MGETLKIPVLGVDNAGKTSLITTLQREFKELSSLAPTKKIERTKRNFFDKKIMVWDGGGQEEDRAKDAKRAETFFSDIGGEAFYVIDLQDKEKFDASFSYFDEIVSAIKEYSPDTTINLLIHKVDPGMESKQEVLDQFKKLSEEFVVRVSPLKMRVCQTTIYNPISVIRAFSKPIFGNTTLYDNFSILFRDFVNETHSDFALIFTDQLLEVGNYFSPHVDQNKMRAIAQEVFNAFDGKGFNMQQIKLKAGDGSVQILEFKPGDDKYFFTFGFNPENVDANQINTKAVGLLSELKTLMKFL